MNNDIEGKRKRCVPVGSMPQALSNSSISDGFKKRRCWSISVWGRSKIKTIQ